MYSRNFEEPGMQTCIPWFSAVDAHCSSMRLAPQIMCMHLSRCYHAQLPPHRQSEQRRHMCNGTNGGGTQFLYLRYVLGNEFLRQNQGGTRERTLLGVELNWWSTEWGHSSIFSIRTWILRGVSHVTTQNRGANQIAGRWRNGVWGNQWGKGAVM